MSDYHNEQNTPITSTHNEQIKTKTQYINIKHIQTVKFSCVSYKLSNSHNIRPINYCVTHVRFKILTISHINSCNYCDPNSFIHNKLPKL